MKTEKQIPRPTEKMLAQTCSSRKKHPTSHKVKPSWEEVMSFLLISTKEGKVSSPKENYRKILRK